MVNKPLTKKTTHKEIVRVRVLLLKPGNCVRLSVLDHGLSKYCFSQEDMLYGEDYIREGIVRLSSHGLAEELKNVDYDYTELDEDYIPEDHLVCDPLVEVLDSISLVFFDVLTLSPDWTEKKYLPLHRSSDGYYRLFGDSFESLLEIADEVVASNDTSKVYVDGNYGTKVHFNVVYDVTGLAVYDYKHANMFHSWTARLAGVVTGVKTKSIRNGSYKRDSRS